jgi:hypothetical protein
MNALAAISQWPPGTWRPSSRSNAAAVSGGEDVIKATATVAIDGYPGCGQAASGEALEIGFDADGYEHVIDRELGSVR